MFPIGFPINEKRIIHRKGRFNFGKEWGTATFPLGGE